MLLNLISNHIHIAQCCAKIFWDDDEMLIEPYIHMEGEDNIELEPSTNELVDVALGIGYAQGFDLNVDLHWVDLDDVAPPTIKLCDAKRHASLLANFSSDNSFYFVVNKIISSQKLIGNSDKMTIANLCKQHQRSLNSCFKSSWENLHVFGVISYYVIPTILLKLVVHILNLTLLMFSYSLNFTPFVILTRGRHLDNTTFSFCVCFPNKLSTSIVLEGD